MFEELQLLTVEPLQRLVSYLDELVAGRLWLKVLIGMVLGVGVGFVLGPEVGLVEPATAEAVVSWLALPGMLFLALIQMIVIALVFASIIRGLGASDSVAQLRALGLRAAAYFVFTSAMAIGLGIGVALLIRPGDYIEMDVEVELDLAATTPTSSAATASLPERVVGLLPDNPIAAMADGQLLQIVLFAIVIGVALVSMPNEKSRPLFDLLGAIQEVCMTVVKFGMRLAPLAVFGLMTRVSATTGLDTLVGVGVYVLAVLGGLLALVCVYLVLVTVFGRMKPWTFLAAAREVQLLAFSTSSSAAVMPLSMSTAEQKLGVRPASARFLIPLGSTINMDGTALYQGVATLFLAQAFGIELNTGALALVVVTAVAGSIGAPATPGVGIVVLASVLEGAGIPTAGIAMILGVDRLLDMSRTAVNVTGDLTAAVVLDRWMGDELDNPASEPPGAS
ncbi:Proton glutamate symport protein [Enhygromyxa salina]|uniref:Proton glutamate symport protein n=1 Tax=Enhygromyxa salina TaxID=215803 RepID=A0A2S9XXE3_9BACT|nr:dicarboxylate/amino acid:cation symporter [Enhygromyxa salina]PRP97538.1 Proton glutamate symport protein [Enhygromyxa salina]